MADDIETVCKRMVADANAQLEKYEKEQVKAGNKKPASMRTFLSRNPTSGNRDARAQALEVLAGKSWTCSSSHLAGAARHVGPKLNGAPMSSMAPLKKAVSKEDYDKFVEIYAAAMKKQGLRNFVKGASFLPNSKDPLHMELATRVAGKARNRKFEKDHSEWLEAWDQAHPSSTPNPP